MLITGIEHGWTGDACGTRLSGAIRVERGLIVEMGDLAARPGEEVLDARGCVVTPGLVNTHHHLFQSVLKGIAIDSALDDWLARVPYFYWPRLDEETLRISARIGLAELALTGATTVCDHHYVFSDRYDYDPAEILFEEAARFGLRFVLARGGMAKGRDFGGDVPPPPIENVTEFLDGVSSAAARWHDPSPTAMTRVACAPTTPNFNFSPEALPEIAQEARRQGLRLHAHLSENTAYAAQTLKAFGQRPVPWLAGCDWLGDDVWFAHLVDITADEIAMLSETGTAMAHCPQANARLGSGIAPAPTLHKAGGTVSLAVDGAGANEAADMGAALYSAFTFHRAAGGVDATAPGSVLHWATMGGAKALGLTGIGCLRVGMAADIAIFDLSAPRNFGLHDPALAPMITGAATVRHSLVGGRIVVRDGRLPHLDLAELAEDANRVTTRLASAKEAVPV
jgi:cytosine/adenosine deaminase-related metal-dependent hydrolase